MNISPYVGVGELRFGTTTKQILDILREPTRVKRLEHPLFCTVWEYPEAELTCYFAGNCDDLSLCLVILGCSDVQVMLLGFDVFNCDLFDELTRRGLAFSKNADQFDNLCIRVDGLGIEFWTNQDGVLDSVHVYESDFWNKVNCRKAVKPNDDSE